MIRISRSYVLTCLRTYLLTFYLPHFMCNEVPYRTVPDRTRVTADKRTDTRRTCLCGTYVRTTDSVSTSDTYVRSAFRTVHFTAASQLDNREHDDVHLVVRLPVPTGAAPVFRRCRRGKRISQSVSLKYIKLASTNYR